ncbi:MAG: deoxynucleoside kinase [Bacteroidales bacterium]|nr:deoxynucleoside kinase [Bacteroidales bacterium]
MKYNYLVIEGNIGSGKTSLSSRIAHDLNAKLVLEQFADNPFLAKFYEDPSKYAFPLELTFLAERYQQLKDDLSKQDLFKDFTVADYFFYKTLIFAQNTLPADEFKLFSRLFNIIHSSLPKPDLLVFLYVDVDNLIKNIHKRGRSYEKSIQKDYLQKIQNGYLDYIKYNNEKSKILIIDTNNVDFVNNDNDYNRIKNVIFERDYNLGDNRIIL